MPEKQYTYSDNNEPSEDTDTRSDGQKLQKVRTFSSLKFPDFRLLFVGTTLTNAAQWLMQVTLSWLVYDMTGSGTMVGTVNLLRSVSSIAMIPIAGILIDRLSRRKLLIINNSWLFTITAAIGLLLVTGHREMVFIFIFSFLGGFAGTIDNALRQVMVFDLLPRSHTPNGMALIQTGWSIMRSFGPAIGGFLLAWSGAGGNFLIQASAYILIMITILGIKFPKKKAASIEGSAIENIKEGFRYIKSNRTIQTFMLLGFILPLFVIPIYTILPPIYAAEVFGDDSGTTQGFLMAAVGVGGILGGFVTASLGSFERRGLLQLGSMFMVGLSLIGFALSQTLLVSLLFLALSGFFEIIFLVTNQTLMQLAIPTEIRGRVTSVVNLNMVLMPIGNMIIGVGSDLMGGPKGITVVFSCVVLVVVVCFLMFSNTIRNYRISHAINREH
ncbi:MAG: MFS transporter [Dehalococcoidales bacterium]|jgi:MFS family permease|nr:MFS transporter [Dehalococcoidales bacterium]